jgi:hypothetical protein
MNPTDSPATNEITESPATDQTAFTAVDEGLSTAVDAVGTNLSRKRRTGAADPGDVAQVLIRASRDSHERWKVAADKQGISMSEFVRVAADTAAAELLDCAHGAQHRRWYPWAEVCLKCGVQLRDGKRWLVDPGSIPHVRPDAANPAV